MTYADDGMIANMKILHLDCKCYNKDLLQVPQRYALFCNSKLEV